MLFQKFVMGLKRFPKKKCVDHYTYNDLYRLIAKYHYLLDNLGVGRRDRVCWDAPKSVHWPALIMATWMRGAVFVPFNHGNKALNDHIQRVVSPKVVLTDTSIYTISHDPPLLSIGGVPQATDEPSTILFTSGSTSEPKGVVLSHKNILTNLEQISHRMNDDINHTDSAFSILPWHHCYGLVCELLFLMKKGAHISVPHSSSPTAIMREMKWKAPTLFYAVPKVLESIYKNDITRVPGVLKRNVVFGHRIRRISVGGALCPSTLISFMTEHYKVPTIQGYGMTETSPMISLNSIYENRIGSVGRPLKDTRIEFSYENNEILVRGDNVMTGYLKDITKYNEFVVEDTPDEWFHTGDKGYLDKDGFLYISGRTKTHYKLSNGKYVNPTFIEKLLCMSPLIDQAVVFGDGFSRNKVVIHTPEDKKEIGKDAMLAHIRGLLEGRVQHYEVPDDIIFADEAFSQQNGLLTQKLEPNRGKILSLYT